MFYISVFNLEGFLQAVNQCTGAVYLLYPDGTKKDINKKDKLQQELHEQFLENKQYLRLCLDVPQAGDYMSVVCFSLGDY